MTQPEIGIYGLGTMGAALALNMAENGHAVAVANRSPEAVPAFMEKAGPLADAITGCDSLDALIEKLPRPRLLLAMIPSTGPMDAFLDRVLPQLAPGDTVIDAGNASFHDTRARAERLEKGDLHFVGLGVSGGEEGARKGPSMMFGGSQTSWDRLRPILTDIAARHGDSPCVDRMGPDGAGHFVKTVHNGIEYADMQMLAETVDLLRHGTGKAPNEIADILTRWNAGPLNSYLTEITAKLLSYTEADSGQPFIDVILDRAGQKGTGRWTVIEAVRMGQSATMIEAAVAARAWSAEKDLRAATQTAYGADRQPLDIATETLEQALLAARILEYAQGFRILDAASAEFDWALDPPRIAEVWRAGCIIRARMLDDISGAFQDGTPTDRLFLAPRFSDPLQAAIPALRMVVARAMTAGFAVPALASALGFWDTMRQSRGTAATLQAQRDFFGRHGFERTDMDGTDHHGPWWQD